MWVYEVQVSYVGSISGQWKALYFPIFSYIFPIFSYFLNIFSYIFLYFPIYFPIFYYIFPIFFLYVPIFSYIFPIFFLKSLFFLIAGWFMRKMFWGRFGGICGTYLGVFWMYFCDIWGGFQGGKNKGNIEEKRITNIS